MCASALFGTISGSAVANTMSTGIITIPNMKRFGYPATMAGAIEAVSSTGGQIMPPVMGAAAFLMADTLQVRYAAIAIAAIVPAALYYFSVFLQVDYEAARRNIGGLDPATLPKFGRVARDGWGFLIPFAVMFYCMLSLNLEAEPATRARAVSAAKATVGRAARFIGQNAVQLQGGMGMTEELAIGHYFKRLTAVQYEFGSTDHHLARYAELTKE